MRLKDLQLEFHRALDAIYGVEEVNSFFFLLVAHFFDIKRVDLALSPNIEIASTKGIRNALTALQQQKPIQYIVGETEFFGLPFKVNTNVLIPRPETEELVSWIIEQLRIQNSEFRILDIGTGSGCIAIALAKKLPNTSVYAMDVSEKALEVAKANAKLNEVNITFIKADILNYDYPQLVSEIKNEIEKFDIIVSNPPYVRQQEKASMQPNVLENEPHIALFVEDNNPLVFYEAISDFSKTALKKNGKLFFEINEYLGSSTMNVLHNNNFKNIELKQDIFGKDRMVKGVNF
ncbi:release factor glutamine methyltransferase [Hyunsoonleella jejuensis]|uniref:Release factor glutamine methyltransferase n=1 Tax=Hyunsoonleella jejuensis TaxID=419940 RepID=A0A1H9KGQ5_9FLAO|nr:peptide chain release factor N(5)-glutamine methyltransferase [Hyunsoonleella jejuensis]SEQ98321.1 release factor glutamine methyltransferase [Hyunsoonleella jejuensis]